MRNTVLILLLAFAFIGCEEIEPRRPVAVKSGSFLKESAERNRALLQQEDALIRSIIEKDSTREYLHSANGTWYTYEVRNPEADYLPRPDDLVTLTYDIRTLSNDTIYSAEEIGEITYKVDKQELFAGIRNSVKLLKEGETATFYFPSSLAYGYHGDNNKIGTNVPLVSTLTLHRIEKQETTNPNN